MKLKEKIVISLAILSLLIVACDQKRSQENQSKDKDSSATNSELNQTDLPPETYQSSEIDKIGWELLEQETFGEIRLEMDSVSIIKIIGQPDSVTTINYWGADGGYHNEWFYNKLGLTIGMNRVPDHPNHKYQACLADRMTLTSPSKLYTARRIRIGSTRGEVLSNYKLAITDTVGFDNNLVAGTVYGGLLFQLEQDTVVRIFLGAAAE
ncbi:MAG: hypothetical protein KTR30_36660 [Saprospiraceae bacterium]|nr:hypothetical protein [Saprospiraceae bacterium]